MEIVGLCFVFCHSLFCGFAFVWAQGGSFCLLDYRVVPLLATDKKSCKGGAGLNHHK